MELKGEIPWGRIRRLERRNATTLFIHTVRPFPFSSLFASPPSPSDSLLFLLCFSSSDCPQTNRIYYLENVAHINEWVGAIEYMQRLV